MTLIGGASNAELIRIGEALGNDLRALGTVPDDVYITMFISKREGDETKSGWITELPVNVLQVVLADILKRLVN